MTTAQSHYHAACLVADRTRAAAVNSAAALKRRDLRRFSYWFNQKARLRRRFNRHLKQKALLEG